MVSECATTLKMKIVAVESAIESVRAEAAEVTREADVAGVDVEGDSISAIKAAMNVDVKQAEDELNKILGEIKEMKVSEYINESGEGDAAFREALASKLVPVHRTQQI